MERAEDMERSASQLDGLSLSGKLALGFGEDGIEFPLGEKPPAVAIPQGCVDCWSGLRGVISDW